MDFRFTEEEELFRQEVREFLEKEIPTRWKELDLVEMEEMETDETWAIVRAWFRKLGEKGWLALTWPKEYGGQARCPMEELVLNEELEYHRAPTGMAKAIAVNWVGPSIMMFGTEDQKKMYLPKTAKGGLVFCLGYSEPEAGSDLAALQTRAIEEGDDYVINGQKIFTSFAHRADYCWLAARTDPTAAKKHHGISMFVVDMKTSGITVHPLIDVLGRHHFNEVFFDDVRISKENLIGEKNQGWYQMAIALNFERSGVAMPARCKRTLEDLVAYAKETQLSGKPLAEDALVRHSLAERAIEIEVARMLAYRVTWLQSEGVIAHYEASMAWCFTAELQKRLANTGMELLGLYCQLDRGSKWAPLGGRIMREYLTFAGGTVAGGTSEIQKNIIAMRGLGLPRG